MNSTSKTCPDQQTLLQFIQGRLEPPTLDRCEDHVSGCESCHETLRGLDTNDTLSHYVSEALEQQKPENQSDTKAIDGLMQRLLQPGSAGRPNGTRSSSNVEIMADRAAEVLRCVEPPAAGDEDSLGTLGDYRLLRLIGAGGTGVVFQAKDISLDRVVALKVLRPSLGDIARDRFIAEARLAASIEHDNVVTIYQIGQEGRLAFIAMQWLPGETLEARLNRESSPLSEETVRELVVQIASGLSAAHQRQLIHRDIKPANIWICEDTSRIKILDFGLARIADEESSLTQTGMLAGTPSFMSPEQARGMELDPRTDLFSLGCVMYLLLTGRLPFSAPTVLGTLQTIQSDSPNPPVAVDPNCDADLSDLAMSLLEKLPGNRMATAENLIACLNNKRSNWPQSVAVVSGKALSAVPADALMPTAQRLSLSGVGWLIAASLVGILGIMGWLMAPQIFRIVTDQGELVVETSDPNIKIEVLENGDLFRVLDASSKDSFDIKSGKYSFNVVSKDNQSEFEVTPQSVTMTRGGKQLVTVTISQSENPTSKVANISTNANDSDDPLNPAEFMNKSLAEKQRINSIFGELTPDVFGELNIPETHKREIDATVADLVLSVQDPKGLLPTNEEIEYQITVQNRGSQAAKGVELLMQFSEGMEPTKATGLQNRIVPGQVIFDPIAQIEPGQSLTFKVKSIANKSGTHIFRAFLFCDRPHSREVTEGTTKFFDDEVEASTNRKLAALRVQRDQLAKNVGRGHPSIQSIDSQIASIEKHFSSLRSTKEQPIYGGQTFDQWYRIAKNDREPKTVANALEACAVLADTAEKPQMIELLRTLVRIHGAAGTHEINNGGNASNAKDVLFTGLLRSLEQMTPKEIVTFIQTEIEFGNKNSLAFCGQAWPQIWVNDHEKRIKLGANASLNFTPLIERVTSKEFEFTNVIQHFLDQSIGYEKVEVDLDACKSLIETLAVEDRPWAYRTFMSKFSSGEFDQMIQDDFFSPSTSGEARELLLWSLTNYSIPTTHAFPSPNPHQHALSNKLLTTAISKTIAGDSKLKFNLFNDCWFNQHGVIRLSSNGENRFWETNNGTIMSATPPKDAEHIRGQAAVVRHLVTKLCENVDRIKLVNKDESKIDFSTVLNLINETTETDKESIAVIASKDFVSLKIDRDFKALVKFIEEDEFDFSFFVERQSMGGGLGGGGFGGGGGGVF